MTQYPDIIAVVLAAGKGKRMKSDLPKILHPLAGKPLILYLTATLESIGLHKIVLVIGHGREQVQAFFKGSKISFVVQEQQQGTAHATLMAAEHFRGFSGNVLVITGDVPLLTRKSLENLIDYHLQNEYAATVLTSYPPDPTGYGRVVRTEQGTVKKIVEHADATSEERRIGEINTGIFVFRAVDLYDALGKVRDNNSQGEFYLTDVVQILLEQGKLTGAVALGDYREALGVNSTEQLAELERIFQELNVDKGLDKK